MKTPPRKPTTCDINPRSRVVAAKELVEHFTPRQWAQFAPWFAKILAIKAKAKG